MKKLCTIFRGHAGNKIGRRKLTKGCSQKVEEIKRSKMKNYLVIKIMSFKPKLLSKACGDINLIIAKCLSARRGGTIEKYSFLVPSLVEDEFTKKY